MHFHLPKPQHGWRAFVGEVGIIVIGVLIALLFEQIVQRREWQHKVEATEAAMKHELLWDDGPQYYQRAAMHPCIVRQLDAIRASVEANDSRVDVWKRIDGYWIVPLTYDTVAYQAAATSDVSSHIPLSVLEPYLLPYAVMPRTNAIATSEATYMARLRALRRTGAPLSEAEGTQVLNAVEQLRNDDEEMWLGALWTLPQLRKLGSLDQRRIGEFMGDAREHYGSCARDLPPGFPSGAHGG